MSAHVAQSVEHVLGKDEVIGSIPIVGSTIAGPAGGRFLVGAPSAPLFDGDLDVKGKI